MSPTDPVPLALLIDDPAPLVHLYRHHVYELEGKADRKDAAGLPLAETIPNAFLGRFCDVVQARGIKGKFSIVPAPAGRGDVVRGIEGHPPALTRAWLDTARRLAPFMDFCPEMITHGRAVDLATGALLSETEHHWSQHQTRATLTPYVARGLQLLKEAGVDATGVTSPWMFAQEVETEYVAAIAAAQRQVHARDVSWYFLNIPDDPGARSRVMLREGKTVVVSIEASTDDILWDTIWHHGAMTTDQIGALADRWLTADGAGGRIPECLAAGGWPVLLTHWQCLWSNGRETGLAVLDEVAARVARRLAGRVRWCTCLEVARLAAAPADAQSTAAA